MEFEELTGIHETQLLTDKKLVGVKIGLPIDFSNTRMKDGIKRSFFIPFVHFVPFVVHSFSGMVCG